MICAYCGQEQKATKEHIISSCILDLFPECYLTIDDRRGIVHEGDPVIKDVCSDCNNNKLSYIDSYAQNFISDNFLQKYDEQIELEVDYDYVMIQKMLLKFAFNALRSHKDETTFFDKEVIDFLLDKDIKTPLNYVSVLAGIAVNTSPMHDVFFGNKKIQWLKDPLFLSNSIIHNLDYTTGKITTRDNPEKESFDALILSYIFRFNSGQFILTCFDKNKAPFTNDLVKLKFQYPYTLLDQGSSMAKLSRCTSEATYHMLQIIDVSWGNGIMDDISHMRKYATGEDLYNDTMKEISVAWEKEEQELAKKKKRK